MFPITKIANLINPLDACGLSCWNNFIQYKSCVAVSITQQHNLAHRSSKVFRITSLVVSNHLTASESLVTEFKRSRHFDSFVATISSSWLVCQVGQIPEQYIFKASARAIKSGELISMATASCQRSSRLLGLKPASSSSLKAAFTHEVSQLAAASPTGSYRLLQEKQ